MKIACIVACLVLLSTFIHAQKPVKADTIVPGKAPLETQLKQIKEKKILLHSDSTDNTPKKDALIDTTLQNKYGDLLNDDTAYNKKYPFWKPAIAVIGINTFVWAEDRFVADADFSRIGFKTWGDNIKNGWVWDRDRFGINFIGHPYSGTLSFNAARSSGYNYLQSSAFSIGGSLMWEYLGENTRPSYNDIINTPVNGAFLGEIFYRLSSNILDDRTTGRERVFREIFAGIIDPMRGINRLLQKKSFRRTNKEVYEKEPLNITLYGGVQKINDGPKAFGSGPTNTVLIAQFDYGNPFEDIRRKPFDFFKLRTELNLGIGRKILGNITGYGVLFGKNSKAGKLDILVGGFQYYDYWDNRQFELGAIGFGGGVFTKLPLGKKNNLYSDVHIAAVPFAGNSLRFVSDTSQVRDYVFGGGLEGKFESTLTLGKYATASIIYYYYWIHTYVGTSGNNLVAILKPRLTFQLYKNVSIGLEHYVYYNNRYLSELPASHSTKTEQKIFLQIFLEDPQRKGRYN